MFDISSYYLHQVLFITRPKSDFLIFAHLTSSDLADVEYEVIKKQLLIWAFHIIFKEYRVNEKMQLFFCVLHNVISIIIAYCVFTQIRMMKNKLLASQKNSIWVFNVANININFTFFILFCILTNNIVISFVSKVAFQSSLISCNAKNDSLLTVRVETHNFSTPVYVGIR